MLKWVTSFCLTSTFVIKSDTDAEVTPERLITAMFRQKQTHGRFIIGNVKDTESPYRYPASKWYVPYEMYKPDFYPTFVLGPTYGYTSEAAPALYNASTRIPFFFLEDVFITGMCSRTARVPLVKDSLFTYKHLT